MQERETPGQSPLDEQLSAIADGEAGEFEVRRFLEQLDSLPAAEQQRLLAQWERIHRVRDRLRGEAATATAADGFAAALSARLAEEPRPELEVSGAGASAVAERPAATSRFAPFAVAASVALAVVVGFQQFQISQQSEALRVASQAAVDPASRVEQILPAVDVAPPAVAGAGAAVASFNGSAELGEAVDPAEAQRRLQEYLLQHANHAAQQNAQGIVPFARVASFDDAGE